MAGADLAPARALVYRDVPIRDRGEMLSLTDMWRAAGEPARGVWVVQPDWAECWGAADLVHGHHGQRRETLAQLSEAAAPARPAMRREKTVAKYVRLRFRQSGD